MAVIACPRCSGGVWVRDVLVAAPDPTGDLRPRRTPGLDPLRWTCATCGYQASPRGLVSWRLGGAPLAHERSLAAAERSR